MKLDLEHRALALLRGDEGVRTHAYDDATGKRVRAPVGHLTIGAGINLDIGLSSWEIDMLERHRLHVHVSTFTVEVATAYSITMGNLPDDVQVGLALMCFQLGWEGTLEFHNMLRDIAKGHWELAAVEAKHSKWKVETPKRADEVAKLFLYADPKK